VSRLRIGILVASAAVVIAGAILWMSIGDPPPSSSPPPVADSSPVPSPVDQLVTLTLHATGDRSTTVVHTCVDGSGVVGTCTTRLSAASVWTTTVAVPAGTTVRVNADGGVIPPWCSIADESDRNVLNADHAGGSCLWVAGR